ncbi:MAG: 30S ribosomal protein S17 [SAR202 cluster bacterium]|nr:30S ribosomal protein S17 [SAR202 cluster bacterium]
MPGKTLTGRVLSNKMEKTVVVGLDWVEHHKVYQKAIRHVTKLYAHDERGECQVGDVVRLVESRPLSKSKRWLVKGIVTKATSATVGADVGVEEEATGAKTDGEPETAGEGEPA